jgi:hypothetical protein
LGAVIGSCIPIGTNWSSTSNSAVQDGTYIGFLVLMICGAILAFFLVPPSKIIRKDGTRVQRVNHPSFISEMKGLYQTLFSDPHIIFLFPFFWASNYFYTYQQNAYNLYMFNTRSRSFTDLWYWLAQIIGALFFGWFLDNKRMSRRNRAIAGWVLLFLIVNAVVCYSFTFPPPPSLSLPSLSQTLILHQWGGGLKAQLLGISRAPNAESATTWYRGMDIFDRDFTWYCLLYLFYGFLDSVWQTYAYWLMGALSNDPRKLAYFAGFYKVFVPPPPIQHRILRFQDADSGAKGYPIGRRRGRLGHRLGAGLLRHPVRHLLGLLHLGHVLRHPRHHLQDPRNRDHHCGLCHQRREDRDARQ